MDFIYTNIDSLDTPVGQFTVRHNGQKINFSVSKYDSYMPYEVLDENENIIGTIERDTMYYIEIDVDDLTVGEEYEISFSDGIWEYLDSDEHTDCCSSFIDGYVVGIGAYDVNDEEKMKQYFKNNSQDYDKSKFVFYDVEMLSDCRGYSLILLDKSKKYISFPVAWLKVDKFDVSVYEDVLDLWLC